MTLYYVRAVFTSLGTMTIMLGLQWDYDFALLRLYWLSAFILCESLLIGISANQEFPLIAMFISYSTLWWHEISRTLLLQQKKVVFLYIISWKITPVYTWNIHICLKCLHRFNSVFNFLLSKVLCNHVHLGLYFCCLLYSIPKILCKSQSVAHRRPYISLFLWTLVFSGGKKKEKQ